MTAAQETLDRSPAVPGSASGAAARSGPAGQAAHPFVAVVVPALNEAAYIEACLASLIGQWPAGACEILVMDGGSTDGTPALVEAFAARHPGPDCPPIRVLSNPRRIQSAAVNLAARIASPRAAILIRADAHARYPAGFVRRCVADLLRSGATSVVVPMRNEAQPGQGVQRAIAAAQSSRLGNGGSAHRAAPRSGFVDHGHHAAFDRAFFLSLGGYDETFTHNEDAELDHRAVQAGGRVWMCAEEPVTYYPRRSLGSLARQYFRHGGGRARTLLKHRLRPRPRQMAPVIALGGCLGGLLGALVDPVLGLPALLYPAACLSWGAAQAVRRRDPWLAAAGPALMAMHMGWATGFLRAVLRPGRAAPAEAAGPASAAQRAQGAGQAG